MILSPVTSSMDTQEVFGLMFGIGISILVIVLMFLVFRKPFKALWNPERKYILAYGKPAQARILSVGHAREGSTTTINGRIYLKIELEVQDPAAPYITSVEELLSDSEFRLPVCGEGHPDQSPPGELPESRSGLE